ncbi:MAG: hypothetical protein WDM96_17940 [Lacunisphaera sp.]
MNTMMNHWGVIKDRLKQKYAHLSDNDLAYVKDREEEVLCHIAAKTGASREELDREVRDACAIDLAA